ncbi:Head domain of trimeric autotransporter adhesin [Variovorax sp. HW608]|nr:Head domain of trimeric autotransporter adhesin [Variovorax sp. HW608]
MTVDGIDAGGQKIVNVADGTDASDAATVGQVNAAASAAMADAVKYDDASHNSVTLGGTAYDSATGTGGTKVSNVAKGTADSDAVNVAQLKDSGLIDSNGNTLNAVTYDDATKGSITLGGTPYDSVTGTGGTKIGNVAKGTVDSDAVNVAQLKDSGLIDNNGNTLNAVTYDDATKGSVTLGGTPYDSATGTGGTKIGNVAKGTADSDAVNVSQLKDSGLIDGNGNTLNAVTYDDATKGSVTLGGTPYDSATGTGGTKISNVAKGTGDSDAVNVSQLKDAGLIDSNGNTLNAVTYDDATKRSVTLGGVGATTPVRLGNVADGTDDHDAVNVSQLRNSGLLDGNGNTLNAVTYDDATKGIVTLGGVGATTPVRLGNVADGNIAAGSRDAVNGGQIATLVSQINGLDNRVTNIEANGTGGGSSLPYVDGNANGSSSNNADAGSTAGVAVGYNAKATGENASVLGQNATALGSYGTAIGNDSYAAGPNDTALGGNAKVHADGSVAVGANATVTSAAATNAVAVGADTQVSAASGTAIGQGASVAAAATGGVALGQGSVADRANTVSVGTATNQRQITNVAAGSQATDAVNVDQLTSVVNGLGGGASIDSTTGAVTGPSYQLSDGTYSNVGDALSSLDNRVNAANQAIGDLSRNAYSGIAAATALTMIPDVDKDKKLSLGIGAGSYKGYHAFAIGGTARITQNIKMRAGLGRSGSGTTAGVGASYQW